MGRAKKKQNTTPKIRTDRLATSLLVIIFYFIWPVMIGILKDVLNMSDDFFFGIVCNIILIIVLIFIYKKDLKEYAISFNNNRKKMIKTIIIYAIISIFAVALINGIVINVLGINHVTENDLCLRHLLQSHIPHLL